ncbi:TonB-dependent receptor plug domain-containing protein [Mucilaginibacter arboris]|uniref:TonB-dependent receptor n=1 Tax=Mucilaginibacter arboris TaxID=2682090 RepID=A0A7K1SZK1_9SPHI|nr:TonB-dependent receptor [Mucilaginibacter arboris]MVN22688.1 TonB-dependent receptor [Mucilaginibacter arboris]
MKKKFYKTAAGFALAQLLLGSAPIFAQDSVRILKDVVVSATKTDQKQLQTGKVITVITQDQIERSQGKSLAQLLNEQADVIVSGANSNPTANKSVFIRGAASGFAVTLIDGVMVSDPSSPTGGAFDIRLFPIDQIERIEIIKGGQSTLYGSDAVGGVINIITKKGGPEGIGVYGTLTGGSYGSQKQNVGFNGSLSKFSYNVSYTHDQTDGISEAADKNNTGTFDKDGYNQSSLNANFSVEAARGLRISPFFRFTSGSYKYDNGPFADAPNQSLNRYYNAGLTSQYNLGNSNRFNLNYGYTDNTAYYESSYPSSNIGRLHLMDLYYNHDFTENIKFLLGTDDRYTQIKQIGSANVTPNANLYSIYSSLVVNKIAGFLNLEGGGRFNDHNRYGYNFTYDFTPSINLLENKLILFGTVSSAFKAPLLTELFGPYGANPDLKPQKSTNYEAGFSTALLDNQFNLRVAAFRRKLTNAIVYLTNGYQNFDKENDQGLEVEPSYKYKILTLTGFYSFVDGTAVRNGVNTYGLLRRPKQSFGLQAGVQATQTLYVSANFRSYGQRSDYNYPTNVTLPAYQLLDGYAQYGINGRIKVFVNVNNILDKRYQEIYGYNTMGTNFNAGVSFNFQ